jgi:hypothetical protein
MGYYGVQ